MSETYDRVFRCDACGATGIQEISLSRRQCGHIICSQHGEPCKACRPKLPIKRVWKLGDTLQLYSGAKWDMVTLNSAEQVAWANSAKRPEDLPGYEEFLEWIAGRGKMPSLVVKK